MSTAKSVETFSEERNGELLTDAFLQGGMGLGFSLATFGGFWWVCWLVLGGWRDGVLAPLPLAITAVYVGAASWSARRGVDPYQNLLPLTRAEASRREIEEVVANFAGTGLEGLGRREGVAGCATWLIAGPKGFLAGWRAWSQRVQASQELLNRAQQLLELSLEAPRPLEQNSRAGLLLLHLGLVRLEPNSAGTVCVTPTAKGKNLVEAD